MFRNAFLNAINVEKQWLYPLNMDSDIKLQYSDKSTELHVINPTDPDIFVFREVNMQTSQDR